MRWASEHIPGEKLDRSIHQLGVSVDLGVFNILTDDLTLRQVIYFFDFLLKIFRLF
jgi:transcriptional regulator of met regulon